jgi:hypothetical protein
MPIWRGRALVVGGILCCRSALLRDRVVAGKFRSSICIVMEPEPLDAVV